uniref:Uncharacterized protein n=1 Tax=Arion vulgaris TaxID=1028688 RepID=A0A0B7B754_9EUPU
MLVLTPMREWTIIQELRMDIGDVFQSLGDHLLDDDTKIDVEYIQCLKSLELHK